jgi:hypothetical protein
MQKMSKFDAPSSRDDLADLALRNWFSLHKNVGLLLKQLTARERKLAVAALRDAHAIMQCLAPVMRGFGYFPEIQVKTKERLLGCSVVEFLGGGSLSSVADWLDSWVVSRGPRPLPSIIAQAALDLATISKHTTGKTDWKWIQTRINAQFGTSGGQFAGGQRSLYDLTQKYKSNKLGTLKQRPNNDFKLFADPPAAKSSRPISDKELNAFFELIQVRNSDPESPKKTRAREPLPRFQPYRSRSISIKTTV